MKKPTIKEAIRYYIHYFEAAVKHYKALQKGAEYQLRILKKAQEVIDGQTSKRTNRQAKRVSNKTRQDTKETRRTKRQSLEDIKQTIKHNKTTGNQNKGFRR